MVRNPPVPLRAVHGSRRHREVIVPEVSALPIISHAQMATAMTITPTAAQSAVVRSMSVRIQRRRLIQGVSLEKPVVPAPLTFAQPLIDHAARADGSILSMRSYMPTAQTLEMRIELDRRERDGRTSTEFIRATYEVGAP